MDDEIESLKEQLAKQKQISTALLGQIKKQLAKENRIATMFGHQNALKVELKETKSELLQQINAFETLLESSPDAILLIEGKKIVVCNPAAKTLLGLEEIDITTLTPIDISPEFQNYGETSEQKAKKIFEAVFSRGSYRFQWICKHSSGKEFWADIVLTVLKLNNKEVVYASLRDISKTKKLEEDLKSYQKNLEQKVQVRTQELEKERAAAEKASEAKSNFLAVMSHEIRTPLNGLIATLSLVESEELSTENKELIDTANYSSELLTNIINDVLDFSKIESGKFSLNNKTINIHNLIKQVSTNYQANIEHKKLKFNISVENMPSHDFFGDPLRIKQIVNNFLSNAIKFTDHGSIGLKVEYLATEELLFSISDSGIGLKEESIKQLFTDFTQVHTGSKRNYGGTGLGLAICKKLAHLMQGEVGVYSTFGEGSTFTLLLKLPHTEVSQQETVGNPASHIVLNVEDRHILLVEDNKINQLVAKKMFSKINCDYDVAQNGQECLDLLEKQKFDLILMDCQMPIMDGFEATLKIREQGDSTPIVALTANVQETERQRCLEVGMNDFLSKPYKLNELRTIIFNNLLNQESSQLGSKLKV
jgi:PAS domain S-box-containing protein